MNPLLAAQSYDSDALNKILDDGGFLALILSLLIIIWTLLWVFFPVFVYFRLGRIAKATEGLLAEQQGRSAIAKAADPPKIHNSPLPPKLASPLPPKEKTVFDVVLIGDRGNKIQVIEALRAVRRGTAGADALGLAEAKDLVENTPTLVLEGATKLEAEAAKAKLEVAGAVTGIDVRKIPM